jgi:hypothetical protein
MGERRGRLKKRGGATTRRRLGTRDYVVIAAVALGLSCSMSVWGVRSSLALLVSFTLSAAIVLGVVTEHPSTGVHTGIAVGICLAAGVGLLAALSWLGLLIILALLATSPALRSSLDGWWRPGRPRRTREARAPLPDPGHETIEPAQQVDKDPADLRTLDDAALCLAWRRSFVRLESQRGAAARLAIVEQRQRYLDELQRRHGAAFQSWLESGARASGNPLPYLEGPPPGSGRSPGEDQGQDFPA